MGRDYFAMEVHYHPNGKFSGLWLWKINYIEGLSFICDNSDDFELWNYSYFHLISQASQI